MDEPTLIVLENDRMELDPQDSYICAMDTLEETSDTFYSIPIRPEEGIVFYVGEGKGILYTDYDCTIISKKTTVLFKGNHYCLYNPKEGGFTCIRIRNVPPFFPKGIVCYEQIFHQKTEIFIESINSSLHKYAQTDSYSMYSSLYRFYSDLSHFMKGIKEYDSKQAVLEKTIHYIEHHYTEPITLDLLSDALGYSKYYISHLFKEEMGLSVYDYVIRRRLLRVKRKLIESEQSIEEIALESGFSSDISLYRTFKRVYSITPKQFKKVFQYKNKKG